MAQERPVRPLPVFRGPAIGQPRIEPLMGPVRVREQHVGECLRLRRTNRNSYAVEQWSHGSQCHRRRRAATAGARGCAQALETRCSRNACGDGSRGPAPRGVGLGEIYVRTMTSMTREGPRVSSQGRRSRLHDDPKPSADTDLRFSMRRLTGVLSVPRLHPLVNVMYIRNERVAPGAHGV